MSRGAFAPKGASCFLVLVMALSYLAGVLCGGGPADEAAMECCRKDAHHCNMPEKSNDCCKPDRSGKNPASMASSIAAPTAKMTLDAAVLPAEVSAPSIGFRIARLLPARGSPFLLVHRPLDVPLLI